MKKGIRVFITGLCVVLFLTVPFISHASDQDVIADWIIQLQYTDPNLSSYGAFRLHHTPGYIDPNYNLYYRVVPYFNHTAVLGLLETDTAGKLEVAEAWISWYLDHMDMDAPIPGVVYDHWYLADGTGETTAPEGIDPAYVDYEDSADAYAALFLEVVYAYYKEGGSLDFLNTQGYKEKFQMIGDVMLALQDPADGLTWAKEGWPVKYLMCNVEVYSGLRAMQRLMADVFNDNALSQTYEMAGDAVKAGIKNEFYDKDTGLYNWAIYSDGFVESADLNMWYPGSVHLAWPLLFELENPKNKKSVYQMIALNESWDGEPNPDWTSSIIDEFGFMWPAIGYASLLAGDVDSAQAQMDFILGTKLPDFPWPFTIDDAGWLLRTLGALEDMGIVVDSGDGGGDPGGTDPGEEVQEVIASLEQYLPTGDPAADQSIESAIDHMNKSFDQSLWLDSSHLTGQGNKVFDSGKQAVQKLLSVVHGGGAASEEAQSTIDWLMDVYANLAITAVDDAVEALESLGCYGADPAKECTKLVRDIDSASQELADAAGELAKGNYDKAIAHYKQAWQLAQIF